MSEEAGKLVEPKVMKATLRDTDDSIDVECRFSDGQKFAAIRVDSEFEELAITVVNFLNNEYRMRNSHDDFHEMLPKNNIALAINELMIENNEDEGVRKETVKKLNNPDRFEVIKVLKPLKQYHHCVAKKIGITYDDLMTLFRLESRVFKYLI